MVEIDTMVTQSLNIQNITGCIPVEKVLESLPFLVLKSDALKLASSCLFVGFTLGAVTFYFLTREYYARKAGVI